MRWVELFESQNWWRASEVELREFATQFVGWATNEMGDPAGLHWTVENLDLDVFNNYANDWEWYFADERIQDRYGKAFINKPFHTPIVVSFENDELIIWDGYHRIATAIHRGDDTIMAVVGRD
jgi:hypothetical protein